MMKKPKDVSVYIATTPKEVRSKLKKLRKAIKTAAPKAEERISYGMPYYDYKGRVVYFAAFKKHISIFVPTPIVEQHKRELKDYETTRVTIRFPLDKKLPTALIKKLIKARVKMNEAKKK